jgi:hypothetical protein
MLIIQQGWGQHLGWGYRGLGYGGLVLSVFEYNRSFVELFNLTIITTRLLNLFSLFSPHLSGLGGRGGPYRLDKGHKVHQVSDAAKAEVSEVAKYVNVCKSNNKHILFRFVRFCLHLYSFYIKARKLVRLPHLRLKSACLPLV